MVEAEVTPRCRDEKTTCERAMRKVATWKKGKDRRRGNGGPAPTTLRYDSPGVANRFRTEPFRRPPAAVEADKSCTFTKTYSH